MVTGGSSGIGAALGKRLANDGVEVVLAARRREALEELAEEIRADGGPRALPRGASAPARIDFPLSIAWALRVMGSLPRFVQSAIVRRLDAARADPEDVRSGRWQLDIGVE